MPGHAQHVGLTAQAPFGADLARHAGHLARKGAQLIDHRVDGLLQLEDFTADVHRDLLGQIALGNRRGDFGDVPDLTGQVRRHGVDAVGQVLPGARHALELRLTAQASFGADLARDARHFRCESIELIDHRVDSLLQLQDLAADVHRDLLGQVAVGDGGGDLGDVADLSRQIAGHGIDAVGQVLPGARHAQHIGLTAQASFGADLARHARHFRCESVELIDHRVDGLLQLQDLAADVHGDLLGQVAAGDGGGDLGDVADLSRQVAGHGVDAVRQVLPGARHARHLGLPAQTSLGADLARHARHLAGESVELIDHRVDGLLQLQDLAADIHRDLARQVAAGHGRRHLGDVADLRRQVAAHGVDRVGQILPGARHAGHKRLTAQFPFRTDLAGHAGHLGGEGAKLVDHRVDGFLELKDLAPDIDGDLLGKVAVGDGDRHVGDVPHLGREVRCHRVDALGQVLPDAGHLRHLRLTAQLAVGSDLARDARHLGGEDAQLLDHGVDDGGGAEELPLQGAAIDVQRHGLQQIALGDRRDGAGHRVGRPEQVVDQGVDRGFHIDPGAARRAETHPCPGLPFPTDSLADQLQLLSHPLIGGNDIIERIGDLASQLRPVPR